MELTQAITAYVSGISATILLGAGIAHLLRPQALIDAVLAHRVLDPRVGRVVARGLPPVEVTLGGLSLLAVRSAVPAAGAQAVLFMTAVLGGSFLVYLGIARQRTRGAATTCGCSPLPVRLDDPLSQLAALTVTSLSLGALLLPRGPSPDWSAELAVVLLQSLAIGMLVIILPAVRTRPGRLA